MQLELIFSDLKMAVMSLWQLSGLMTRKTAEQSRLFRRIDRIFWQNHKFLRKLPKKSLGNRVY